MKDIYLLLTKSDTFISKAIYLMTQDSYTHISISFEENLQPMYSCARKYTYSPIPAGIRNESFEKGFYNKNQHIPCALYTLTVKKEIYYKAKFILESILNHSQDYKYNLMGLILCKLEVPYRRNHYYFCSEFVSEVLEKSNAIELPKHPSLMRPADYTNIDGINCLFDGKLHELKSSIRPGYQYC